MTDYFNRNNLTDRDILTFAEAVSQDGTFDSQYPASCAARVVSKALQNIRSLLTDASQRTDAIWRDVEQLRVSEAAAAAVQPVLWRPIEAASRELEEGQEVWVARCGSVYPARYRRETGARHAHFDAHGTLYWVHDTFLQGWAFRVTPTFTGLT